MNRENVTRYLVPVVAVIVLVESLLLISNLESRKQTVEVATEPKVELTENPKVEEAVVEFNLAENKNTVTVSMVANSDRELESINLYIKYDPELVNISSLVFDKKIGTPVMSKVDPTNKVITVNYVFAKDDGLMLKTGERVTIMTYKIKPKLADKFKFEISTGNEMKESATMIVENATNMVLPFASNELTINVTQ